LRHQPPPRTSRTLWTAIVLAAAISAGCDAYTGARGRVTDESQIPIADAEVRLVSLKTGKVDLRRTEQDGSFVSGIVHGLGAGRFVLVVSKPGYVTFRHDIKAKTAVQLDVVLTRKENSPK
jgi:hypothetical protein